MYRLAKGKEEIILRFSKKVPYKMEDREEICRLLMSGKINFDRMTTIDSIVLFHTELGAIFVQIDRHPSLILTVTASVPKERWYNMSAL
ncbi:hypothetical protein BN1002_02442 [Bacillus sp. B-jedd]|nr:hypothetical protein BN1002_02442 [Bacillus sp. B-jedd]